MHCSLCLEGLFLPSLLGIHFFSRGVSASKKPHQVVGALLLQHLCGEFFWVPVCLPTSPGCPQGQARPEAPTLSVFLRSLKSRRMEAREPPGQVSVVGEGTHKHC